MGGSAPPSNTAGSAPSPQSSAPSGTPPPGLSGSPAGAAPLGSPLGAPAGPASSPGPPQAAPSAAPPMGQAQYPLGQSQPPPMGQGQAPPMGQAQAPPMGQAPYPMGQAQAPPMGQAQAPPMGQAQYPMGQAQAPPVGQAQPPTGQQQLPVGAAGLPRARINREQMPSSAREVSAFTAYMTPSDAPPPSALSRAVFADVGSAAPAFVRPTVRAFPATARVAAQCALPLAVTVAPLARHASRASAVTFPLAPEAEEAESAESSESTGYSESTRTKSAAPRGGLALPAVPLTEAPPRCRRCGAFVCSAVAFTDGGRRFECAICKVAQDVPEAYFCPLDYNTGLRHDAHTRAELCKGSVDFPVPRTADPNADAGNPASKGVSVTATSGTNKVSEGVDELHGPPRRVLFLIDCCAKARSAGALRAVFDALRAMLLGGGGARCEVGFVCYAKELTFVDLGAPTPALLVAPRAERREDVFCPLPPARMFRRADRSKDGVERALDVLERAFLGAEGKAQGDDSSGHGHSHPHANANANANAASVANAHAEDAEGAFGAAALVALEALAGGGRAFIFAGSVPMEKGQPGWLRARFEARLLGTPKEAKLYRGQASEPSWFYTKLRGEAAERGVCYELFFFPYVCEASTLAPLAFATGGRAHLYPNFYGSLAQTKRFAADLYSAFRAEFGAAATVKLRCSAGVGVSHVVAGKWKQGPGGVEEVLLGGVGEDTALTFALKHDGDLKEHEPVVLQAATLYLSSSGERRVRLHTLKIGVSAKPAEVFARADVDAVAATLIRQTAFRLNETSYKVQHVVEPLLSLPVDALAAYRLHCAQQRGGGGGSLLLPEALKLLPLYVLGALKSDAFLPESAVRPDPRVVEFWDFASLPVEALIRRVAKRLVPLHEFSEACGLPMEAFARLLEQQRHGDVDAHLEERALQKMVQLPEALPLTAASLQPHGAYALDDGQCVIIWVGAEVSQAFCEQVLGVQNLQHVASDQLSLQELDNEYSRRVRAIVQALCDRGQPVLFVKQHEKHELRPQLFQALVEDVQFDKPSYDDFLISIHSAISKRIDK